MEGDYTQNPVVSEMAMLRQLRNVRLLQKNRTPSYYDVRIPDGKAMRDQTLAVTPNPAVARAIGLLWLGLILLVVCVLLDAANLTRANSSVYIALLVILTVALCSFFIRKISEGKNWARIVYLVLFLQAALRFISKVPAEFNRYPVLAILGFVGIGLQAVALLWVFADPGKQWFETQCS